MNWEPTQLGELITVKHGYAFKSQFFAEEGKYVLLSPGNFHEKGGLKLKGDKEKYYTGDFPNEYLLKAGDLIVVMTDLVNTAPILGGSAIIPEDDKFLHNQRLGLVEIKDREKIDKGYLYHLLNTRDYRGQIRGSASGATVKHTAPERIYRCSLGVPKDLKTQRRIASVLTSYDDLIETNRRRIKLLEESARLLYEEWFVRLRFRGHEHTKIVKGVPEGWEKRKLKELGSLVMGQSPKSQYYNENGEGLPFHQGVSHFGDRFVTHSTYCTISGRIAEPGDILISVRAPVGRLNMTLDKIVIGRGLAAIKSNIGHQSFLYQQLKTHFHKEDIIGSGAIFASVTRKQLEDQQLLTPVDSLIAEYESVNYPIDKQIECLFRQNAKLRIARDTLLPKLMSGEIEV